MESTVVEQLWASDRQLRALIMRRCDHLLELHIERFFPGNREFEEPPGWELVSRTVSLFDAVDSARESAVAELHAAGAVGITAEPPSISTHDERA